MNIFHIHERKWRADMMVSSYYYETLAARVQLPGRISRPRVLVYVYISKHSLNK